jgi:hypothetical protein
MPREETTTRLIYKFEELDPIAKIHAKGDYAIHNGYSWSDDALASLKKFAEHFGAKLHRYEVDFFDGVYSHARFTIPDEDPTPEEIAAKLAELGTYNPETLRGNGDCALTGYCMEEDCIDGFRIALIRDNETDLAKLLEAGFRTWLHAAQEDCRAFYEDENFAEHCEANSYEFDEKGNLV